VAGRQARTEDDGTNKLKQLKAETDAGATDGETCARGLTAFARMPASCFTAHHDASRQVEPGHTQCGHTVGQDLPGRLLLAVRRTGLPILPPEPSWLLQTKPGFAPPAPLLSSCEGRPAGRVRVDGRRKL
jgi:hypothetical protein